MTFASGGAFDSLDHGLVGTWFTLNLTHNVQATVPTGPSALRKPYTVVLAQDYSSNTQRPIGFAWDLDADNQPRVTIQLASGSGTIGVRVWVGYQK